MNEPPDTAVAANRNALDRFVRFINTGDRALGEAVVSPDVVFHAPTSPEPMCGFGGYMAVLGMMRGAMPDVQWRVEETVAEGACIAVRFTMTGTNTGPFMGMPPTGKRIRVSAMNLYEFKDGRIVREHGLPDLFSLLAQLGVLPPPGVPPP